MLQAPRGTAKRPTWQKGSGVFCRGRACPWSSFRRSSASLELERKVHETKSLHSFEVFFDSFFSRLFVDRNLWGFVVLIVVDFFIWLRVFVGLLVISWPSLSQSRHFWAFSVHSLSVIVVSVCVCVWFLNGNVFCFGFWNGGWSKESWNLGFLNDTNTLYKSQNLLCLHSVFKGSSEIIY
jgi:hypothetical protein